MKHVPAPQTPKRRCAFSTLRVKKCRFRGQEGKCSRQTRAGEALRSARDTPILRAAGFIQCRPCSPAQVQASEISGARARPATGGRAVRQRRGSRRNSGYRRFRQAIFCPLVIAGVSATSWKRQFAKKSACAPGQAGKGALRSTGGVRRRRRIIYVMEPRNGTHRPTSLHEHGAPHLRRIEVRLHRLTLALHHLLLVAHDM